MMATFAEHTHNEPPSTGYRVWLSSGIVLLLRERGRQEALQATSRLCMQNAGIFKVEKFQQFMESI